MAAPLAEQITAQLERAEGLYHRLVLVVAPSGSGKSEALGEVARLKRYPLLNVNLELSRALLELAERQRSLMCQQVLLDAVEDQSGSVVLLDNLEALFDCSLQQDPLRLLQRLSRNRTIVASCNGRIEGQWLTYAAPGHPEYRRFPSSGILVVAPPSAT